MKNPEDEAMNRKIPILLTVLLALDCSSGRKNGNACEPYLTRACLGPGPCKGGQECLPDGTAWGACDCGGTDACAGRDQCFAATYETDLVVSWKTPGGYETNVTTGSGDQYRIVWEETESDGSVESTSLSFTLWLPDGTTIGPASLGPVVTDEQGTATGGIFIVRSVASALDNSNPGDSSGSGLLNIGGRRLQYEGSFTGENPASPWSNAAGCDSIISGCSCATSGGNALNLFNLICPDRGACCDAHDECITASCGNGRGTGNVGNYFAYLPTAMVVMSPGCQVCHLAVAACFTKSLKSSQGPIGVSNCCSEASVQHPGNAKSCGDQQECMIGGRVITDPCVCLKHTPSYTPITKTSNSCGTGGSGNSGGGGSTGGSGNDQGNSAFEFVADENVPISGGGGFRVKYDLHIEADLQSGIGLNTYTLRSATLKVDIEYFSTPLCKNSDEDAVDCASIGVPQLSESTTVNFQTNDFDLASGTLQYMPGILSSGSTTDDFYYIILTLTHDVSVTTPKGTRILYASGEQLWLGTSNDSGFPEQGYFHSALILPNPYYPLGISPGGLVVGKASTTSASGGP